MKEFNKVNPMLAETMKTHLINDLDEFGVWNNDYDTFFQKRAEVISEEIKKRIIDQHIGAASGNAEDEVASSDEDEIDELIEVDQVVNDILDDEEDIEEVEDAEENINNNRTLFFTDSDFNAFDEKLPHLKIIR